MDYSVSSDVQVLTQNMEDNAESASSTSTVAPTPRHIVMQTGWRKDPAVTEIMAKQIPAGTFAEQIITQPSVTDENVFRDVDALLVHLRLWGVQKEQEDAQKILEKRWEAVQRATFTAEQFINRVSEIMRDTQSGQDYDEGTVPALAQKTDIKDKLYEFAARADEACRTVFRRSLADLTAELHWKRRFNNGTLKENADEYVDMRETAAKRRRGEPHLLSI